MWQKLALWFGFVLCPVCHWLSFFISEFLLLFESHFSNQETISFDISLRFSRMFLFWKSGTSGIIMLPRVSNVMACSCIKDATL